jgi:capsular polysaccharide biosynthesis protein
MLAACLAVVFAFAIILCVASAYLDDRVFDRQDVERLDILPVIAVIPRTPAPLRQLPAPRDPPS